MRALKLLSLAAVFIPFVFGQEFWDYDKDEYFRTPIKLDIPATSYIGYWYNYCFPVCPLPISEMPDYYNVIIAMHMSSSSNFEIPTFQLDPVIRLDDESFRNEVIDLNRYKHVSVLISIGCHNDHLKLRPWHTNRLKQELLRVGKTYGFNGIHINPVMRMRSDETIATIFEAVRQVRAEYKNEDGAFYWYWYWYWTWATGGGGWYMRPHRKLGFNVILGAKLSSPCDDTFQRNFMEQFRKSNEIEASVDQMILSYSYRDISWLESSADGHIDTGSQLVNTFDRLKICLEQYEILPNKIIYEVLDRPLADEKQMSEFNKFNTSDILGLYEHETLGGIAIRDQFGKDSVSHRQELYDGMKELNYSTEDIEEIAEELEGHRYDGKWWDLKSEKDD